MGDIVESAITLVFAGGAIFVAARFLGLAAQSANYSRDAMLSILLAAVAILAMLLFAMTAHEGLDTIAASAVGGLVVSLTRHGGSERED